ncbi:unnamed protein product [Ostreobium quekettii]|uniref:FYVE-type domain-containing protein n=1 Tax=Ostreobium quekettii TaxID=121088 RepID=A0A8S1J300_9CHLO|nr:unnamed protein product [Ostreobium quekettii]|eukprot:evm.model.scf_1079EXC.4 EVM.evm.TU.scf_1079EXC.4   scf_1079EXC:20318-22569(+)
MDQCPRCLGLGGLDACGSPVAGASPTSASFCSVCDGECFLPLTVVADLKRCPRCGDASNPKCPWCHGRGYFRGVVASCRACNGRGLISGSGEDGLEPCAACGGRGCVGDGEGESRLAKSPVGEDGAGEGCQSSATDGGVEESEWDRALSGAKAALLSRDPEEMHRSIRQLAHLHMHCPSSSMGAVVQSHLLQLRSAFHEIKAAWEVRQNLQRGYLLKQIVESKRELGRILEAPEDKGDLLLDEQSGLLQALRCHLESLDKLLGARFTQWQEPLPGGQLATEGNLAAALLREGELRAEVFERSQAVHVAVHDALCAKHDYERLHSQDELKLQALELKHLLAGAPGRFHAAQKDFRYAQQILQQLKLVWNKEMEDRMQRRPPWMPDTSTTECMKCRSKFGVFSRRHHCRACGLIFCHDCSRHRKPLPALAYFKPERVCNICHPLNYEPKDWWDFAV